MANLSNLQPELLGVIAKRLKKLEDFVSFRCVSKSLFAAVKDEYFEGQRTPYLMLPVKDGNDDVRDLYSLVEGESIVGSIKVPNLKTKKCLESLGWLLIVGEDGNMSLLDPFLGTEIPLPHQSTFRGRGNDKFTLSDVRLVQKMVLSARPSETSDFVLMVIYADSQYLGFWRLGDKAWNYIDSSSKGVYCKDVVYDGVGKLFYAIGFPAAVWAFNLAEYGNTEEGRLITSCTEVTPTLASSNLYILKTVDALLFITRAAPDMRDEVCCMTTEFGVYEVDIARGKYKQIDSLGSMAVFLGQNSSTMAVDASTFTGGVIKPNHIYFTDDDFEDLYYDSPEGGGMDIGVYNMETKTVEPIYTGEPLLSKISPSIWITPSPVPSEGVLEWVYKDNRRFLHAVYRVGDLDKTIKFYTESLGMQLLRKRDIPDEKYSNAFLGFGPEQSHFVVELTYNYGVDKYDIGTGFGHFAIATQDVHKLVEDIKAKGVGTVTREPGPVKGGNSVIAFAKDPDGYLFELIQREPTPEPLCQVMLRVGDLDRSIKFYEKALGMKLLMKIDRPEQKYTLATLGYAEEKETTVLELTYNYGVTEYTKGNAYAQVAISTDDVYKSAEAVNHVIHELGGKITRQPGPLPGINTKIVAFVDPDGWKTVLVDNTDFLKELEKKED